MTRTPQWQIVAHLLRTRGNTGVHTFELRQAYIANPSERIAELQRDGWVISAKREKLNGGAFGARYRLVSEPGVVAGLVPSVSSPPDGASHQGGGAGQSTGLFEIGAPQMSVYEHDVHGEAA